MDFNFLYKFTFKFYSVQYYNLLLTGLQGVFLSIFQSQLISTSFYNFEFSNRKNNLSYKLYYFSPLKLIKTFSYFSTFSFRIFSNNFSKKNYCFSREFYYSRYLNYFLFGFICSKSFLLKLKIKIFNFLKGNLFVNNFTNKLYSFLLKEKSFVFLGYKFSFFV